MKHWTKKSSGVKKPRPMLGDVKTKTIFLWWPFLHTDGEYYWFGFVDMEYTFDKVGHFYFPWGIFYYDEWRKKQNYIFF